MKEQLSSSYIQDMKRTHALKKIASVRAALIIGSTVVPPNIGYAIADRLRKDGISTSEPSKNELDIRELEYTSLIDYKQHDILVCSNGFTELDWFEDTHIDIIQNTFDINVVGSLKLAHLFVNETIHEPHKKYIVFIGSMGYRNVLNGSVAYCASKAALAHATKCLGWELAPKGYEVFCVHPSNTEDTPMAEKTIEGLMRYRHLTREQAEGYWGTSLPREKWLQPEDIAEVVSFLVSGRADYMSGSNIDLAGGQR